MERNPEVPAGSRRIRTYEEFESYLRDFALGKEPFLWIVGRPGLSKSQSILKATAKRKVLHIGAGQITPLAFYVEVYRALGLPIILDDAEHLLDAPLGYRIVNALGNTDGKRKLGYYSSAKYLEGEGVPKTFYTNSPLCVIANRTTSHASIMSRATLLYLDLPNGEIHDGVSSWFWDQEIYDFFGRYLHTLVPIDVRWYVQAARDKKNRRDWRKLVLDNHSVQSEESIVQELEVDPRCLTAEECAAEFEKRTGRKRRTYFGIKKRLKEAGKLTPAQPPTRPVQGAPPERVDLSDLQYENQVANLRPGEEAPPPIWVKSVDVPTPDPREAFENRNSQPSSTVRAQPFVTDDTVPWEKPTLCPECPGCKRSLASDVTVCPHCQYRTG